MPSIPQEKHPKQLANSIREALLGIEAPKTALLLDLLLMLDFNLGQWVTLSQCYELCKPYTAEHIIREGLLHFTIKRETLPTTAPGRPTYRYKLPTIKELNRDLVVQSTYISDTLTLEDCKNVKAYRKALHRELINRGYNDAGHWAVVFSRKLMAQRLNVCVETLRVYEKELKTHVEARFEHKTITHKFEVAFLPKKKVHDGRHLLIKSNGIAVKRMPCVDKIAGLYLKRGYEVVVTKRICNAYAPIDPRSREALLQRHGEWASIMKT